MSVLPSPPSSTAMAVPTTLLKKLVEQNLAGQLTIYDPVDSSVQWRIYLSGGNVHYVHSLVGQRERLTYLLGRLFPQKPIQLPAKITSDYSFLCEWWKSRNLSIQNIRQILYRFSQEALAQILAIPQAQFAFEKNVRLDPLILSVDHANIINSSVPAIREWIKVRSTIPSPLSRFSFSDPHIMSQQLWNNPQDYQFLESLKPYWEKQLSLYEIAYLTEKSVIDLAVSLQTLVKANIITTYPYQSIEQDQRPLVACIDDSKSVQRVVKLTLENQGYRVVSITEPAQALTLFIRLKPALILMDINMPEIDGYELSRMLQKSTLLKDVPIIMLTGRDGVLDRIRARMVGSVGYINKPFRPLELVEMIKSHLPLPD